MQADVEHGDSPGLTTDERAELVRLRRENLGVALVISWVWAWVPVRRGAAFLLATPAGT